MISICRVLVAAASLLAVISAEAAEPGFHLIYTSDVRGTVGICG
jgi:hypothetical protein